MILLATKSICLSQSLLERTWDDVYSMRFGVKFSGGASSFSNFRLKPDYSSSTVDATISYSSIHPQFAWELGVLLQNTFYDNLFVQSECMYKENEIRLGSGFLDNGENKQSVKYLKTKGMRATSNIGKKVEISEKSCLLMGAGFHLSLDFLGDDYINENTKSDISLDAPFYNKLDIGPTAIIAIENNNVQVGLNFAYGLVPKIEGYSGAKSLELKLGAAYFF